MGKKRWTEISQTPELFQQAYFLEKSLGTTIQTPLLDREAKCMSGDLVIFNPEGRLLLLKHMTEKALELEFQLDQDAGIVFPTKIKWSSSNSSTEN